MGRSGSDSFRRTLLSGIPCLVSGGPANLLADRSRLPAIMTVTCIGHQRVAFVIEIGEALATRAGSRRGRKPDDILAGLAVATQVAAALSLVRHDLGTLYQRPGEPVKLGEHHLGVAVLQVQQAPGLVQHIEVGQAQRMLPPARSQQVGGSAPGRRASSSWGCRDQASPRGPRSWRRCGARRLLSARRAMSTSTRTRSRMRHKTLESPVR